MIHHDTVEIVKTPSKRSRGSRADTHVPKTTVTVAEDSAGHPIVTTTIEEHDVGGRYPHSVHPPTTVAQDPPSRGSGSRPSRVAATELGNIPTSVAPPPATVVVTPPPPTIITPGPPVATAYDPITRPHTPVGAGPPAVTVVGDASSGGLVVKPVPSVAPPLTTASK